MAAFGRLLHRLLLASSGPSSPNDSQRHISKGFIDGKRPKVDTEYPEKQPFAERVATASPFPLRRAELCGGKKTVRSSASATAVKESAFSRTPIPLKPFRHKPASHACRARSETRMIKQLFLPVACPALLPFFAFGVGLFMLSFINLVL